MIFIFLKHLNFLLIYLYTQIYVLKLIFKGKILLVIFMFNLIYFILGLYFISLIRTVLKEYYLKIKSAKTKEKSHLMAKFSFKFKGTVAEKSNIFILKHNKKDLSEENIESDQIVSSKEKRHLAFENAKYMCEECGNIASLDVYNISPTSSDSDENLKVLCKKCSEEYFTKMNLHYD